MKNLNNYVGLFGLVAVLFSCKQEGYIRPEPMIRYKITYKVVIEELCIPGTERYFYTGKPESTMYEGLCMAGVEECMIKGNVLDYVRIFNEITPKREVKNGLDDDCDGVIDNEKK